MRGKRQRFSLSTGPSSKAVPHGSLRHDWLECRLLFIPGVQVPNWEDLITNTKGFERLLDTVSAQMHLLYGCCPWYHLLGSPPFQRNPSVLRLDSLSSQPLQKPSRFWMTRQKTNEVSGGPCTIRWWQNSVTFAYVTIPKEDRPPNLRRRQSCLFHHFKSGHSRPLLFS